MASVEGSQIPGESEIMNDLWGFRKRFYIPEAADAYWSELTSEADRLSEKHKSEYMDELLLLCIYDIEQRHNHQNQSGVILPTGRQLDNVYKRLKKRMENAS